MRIKNKVVFQAVVDRSEFGSNVCRQHFGRRVVRREARSRWFRAFIGSTRDIGVPTRWPVRLLDVRESILRVDFFWLCQFVMS